MKGFVKRTFDYVLDVYGVMYEEVVKKYIARRVEGFWFELPERFGHTSMVIWRSKLMHPKRAEAYIKLYPKETERYEAIKNDGYLDYIRVTEVEE